MVKDKIMEMNRWQERYKNGYTAYMEHSHQKEWIGSDIIPELDANGCSDVIMIHFKYTSNPVGMDTADHAEAGFFHAQAGKYGFYYTLESRSGGASILLYIPDGWKRCERPEKDWIDVLQVSKERIEQGDWSF